MKKARLVRIMLVTLLVGVVGLSAWITTNMFANSALYIRTAPHAGDYSYTTQFISQERLEELQTDGWNGDWITDVEYFKSLTPVGQYGIRINQANTRAVRPDESFMHDEVLIVAKNEYSWLVYNEKNDYYSIINTQYTNEKDWTFFGEVNETIAMEHLEKIDFSEFLDYFSKYTWIRKVIHRITIF